MSITLSSHMWHCCSSCQTWLPTRSNYKWRCWPQYSYFHKKRSLRLYPLPVRWMFAGTWRRYSGRCLAKRNHHQFRGVQSTCYRNFLHVSPISNHKGMCMTFCCTTTMLNPTPVCEPWKWLPKSSGLHCPTLHKVPIWHRQTTMFSVSWRMTFMGQNLWTITFLWRVWNSGWRMQDMNSTTKGTLAITLKLRVMIIL